MVLAIPLKFWVPAHSKVSWSRTMTAKMSVFRPLFWRKSLFWPIPTQWTPPSVIHGWKAMDLLFLMVKRKKYFLNPISRQNFANAFAETPNLNLEVCHKPKIRGEIAQKLCFLGWKTLRVVILLFLSAFFLSFFGGGAEFYETFSICVQILLDSVACFVGSWKLNHKRCLFSMFPFQNP